MYFYVDKFMFNLQSAIHSTPQNVQQLLYTQQANISNNSNFTQRTVLADDGPVRPGIRKVSGFYNIIANLIQLCAFVCLNYSN